MRSLGEYAPTPRRAPGGEDGLFDLDGGLVVEGRFVGGLGGEAELAAGVGVVIAHREDHELAGLGVAVDQVRRSFPLAGGWLVLTTSPGDAGERDVEVADGQQAGAACPSR